MRRAFVIGIAAVLALVPLRGAFAHSTLDKKSVPAATDVDLAVNAPVEELNAYNERLILEVPDGFRVLACGQVEGFACEQSSAEGPRRTLLTWRRTAPGQKVPFVTDRFPFRVHTISVAGKYKFDVNQFYSNGAAAHWDGPEDGERPAPVLTVTPSGTPAVTNTTAKPHEGSPATPAAAGSKATATTASGGQGVATTTTSTTLSGEPAVTSTTRGSTLAIRGVDSDSSSRWVWVVGLGVVLGGGTAAAVTLRRRGSRA